ncbi:MAG: hypothetical protein ABIL01_06070 [Pseudomonadota bacterium]
MTRAGGIEYLRRAGTLLLCVAGFVCLQRPALAAGLLTAGLAFYLLLPGSAPPQGALVHDRLPAIIIPDILGFALSSLFFAMPFWFGPGEGASVGGIHPMAVLTWPLAFGSLAILAVAAHRASAWMRIEDEGLRLASFRRVQLIPYGTIVRVEPYRRGLPAWMRALVPWLAATGRYSAAGAIALARDSRGVRLHLADGRSFVIPRDGFEAPCRRALAALAAHGVAFDPATTSPRPDRLENQIA